MPAMEAEQERREEEEVVKELETLCIQEKQSGSGSVPDLNEVEEILGYRFKNRRLLEDAFTHASFSAGEGGGGGASYERLEYVGDAVLTLLFSKEHYFLYPNFPPGPLTQLRAANVDSEKLARAAVKHGLHRFLRHKKPFLEEKIQRFKQGISEYPLHSNGLVHVPKALADIVESTIGAVFIDSNSSTDTAWTVCKTLLEPIITPETIGTHPVTMLYQFCQKRNLAVKFVDQWKECTAFDVFIGDQHVGRGVCGLKKEIACNRAAKNAMDNIGRILGETDVFQQYHGCLSHIQQSLEQ
ncbi:ribonuclease 3-like protein 3 [Corylus avellana]|uniref:ribonuclease 3-like protein 3 n=1 Tax=Corylus avellana TaxID=13451 RepID=UPI001E202AA7|nr:ribonuclease 3-like protein 3 [Corylus avellana]